MTRANSPLAQRVAKNALVLFLGQALSLLANLAVNVVLARHLGEEQFGAFTYTLVLVSFFALLADFGMKPVLVRELARQPENLSRILGNALLLKFLLLALTFALAFVAPFLFNWSSDLRTLLWILAGNMLLSAKIITLRIVPESVFHVHLRMEIPTLFQTLDAIILIVATLVAVSLHASVNTLALIYVFSNLPGFLLTCVWSMRLVKPRLRWEREIATMFLRESWPIALYLAFMAFYDRLDVLLLEAMKGRNHVGQYAAAFRLVAPLNFIPLALATSLFPLMSRFSASSEEKLRKTYFTGTKILLTLGLALALGASFFAEPIFAWLYPDTFASAATAFVFLMWAQAFGFLNFFLVDFNASINRQSINLYAAIVMSCVNLALDLILIPRYGIMGASLAKIPTNVLGFALLFGLSKPGALQSYLKIVLKLGALAACFAFFLLLIKSLMLLPALLAAGCVYVALVWAFKIFNEEERALFRRMLVRNG